MITNKRWTAFVIALVILLISLLGLISNAQALATAIYNIYLPLVIKQELPPPRPTDTPVPQDVQILPNHSHFVDSIDYHHIVGEIWNNTAKHLRFVKVSVNVFNSSGHLIDTDFTYTNLDTRYHK